MSRRSLSACAGVLAGVLALGACGGGAEPARLDFERMRRQRRLGAYGESGLFSDHMAMRTPPAGTVSREEHALGDVASTGRQRGAYAATPPVAVTPVLLRRGAHEFRIYCAVCHGDDASGGNHTVVGANLHPPPPSLLGDTARTLPPGRVFEIVTRGVGRMPSYAWALPARDRWAIVAYLGTLQRSGR